MSEPITPVSRAPRPRRVGRRALVPTPHAPADDSGEAKAPDSVKRARPLPTPAEVAAFAAQMMGQGGQKRGLRGGPETLDHARHAYLEAEWSGVADRRHARGKIAKREI
jgi:hypothetical protein